MNLLAIKGGNPINTLAVLGLMPAAMALGLLVSGNASLNPQPVTQVDHAIVEKGGSVIINVLENDLLENADNPLNSQRKKCLI